MTAESAPKKSCCTGGGRAAVTVSAGSRTEGVAAPDVADGVEAEATALEAIAHARDGSTEGMVRLEGGEFLMGTTDADAWKDDGEGPVRSVTLTPFWIGATTVTNAQFAAFVEATGYRTDAERFGWSFVFRNHLPAKVQQRLANQTPQHLQWWIGVPGARWDRPWGERSNVRDRMNHPVVHVSWRDALAYCRWAGVRLATEAEWEYAARGGLSGKRYPWGDELTPRGKHRCNIWQGKFPAQDTAEDGYSHTAPADAYEPNGFGLYNVAGNIWEWCGDWFSATWHVEGPAEQTRNDPRGPDAAYLIASAGPAPTGPGSLPPAAKAQGAVDPRLIKVMRGGSYLCHRSYCNRYRVAARHRNTPDSSSDNCGFRVVRDV